MYFANYVYFSLQLNNIRILGLKAVFLHPFGRLKGGRDLHTLRKCTVFHRLCVFYNCLGSIHSINDGFLYAIRLV